MKLIAPADFAGFRCIAGDCKHTCCAGWEIGIDAQTLAVYRTVPGSFGDRLRSRIDCTEDGACFRLDEEERCPFLNEAGLCDIILTLGEDALCQICTDHPRFRNYFADRTEIGLGLCCEAAAGQLVRREEPMRLICIGDDGEDETADPREEALLRLRTHLMELVQDRALPLSERLRNAAAAIGCTVPKPERLIPVLRTLESIEPAWQEALTQPLKERAWETADEQFCCYLLYRHLPGALQDGLVRERVLFALGMTGLIRLLPLERTEAMRLFSAEIEYSDENPAIILDALTAFVTAAM